MYVCTYCVSSPRANCTPLPPSSSERDASSVLYNLIIHLLSCEIENDIHREYSEALQMLLCTAEKNLKVKGDLGMLGKMV